MDEARRLYNGAGGEWGYHFEDEHESIRAELERVLAAKDITEAAKVIEWWSGMEAAIEFARDVRRLAGKSEPLSEVERLTVERDAALAEVARLTELLEFVVSDDE